MIAKIRNQLAPSGVLRAGINLSNFLLVTGRTATGDPEGVSADMAREVAARLEVPVEFVLFDTPGELADAAVKDSWDIGNIGAEPERAKTIAFTAAYVEIEATYLVPAGLSIQSIDAVDREGIRIGVYGRSAYGLWLNDNIRHAELVRQNSHGACLDLLAEDKIDVLAGLRSRRVKDVAQIPGARVLSGQFTAVQQAIGTNPERELAVKFLAELVEQAKASGLVARLIEKHGVEGQLTVAPLV